MNFKFFLVIAIVVVFSQSVFAQTPEMTKVGNGYQKLLDEVVVDGSAVGPGLWHVDAGDHEMWIFGTLSPLPVGISWNSDSLRSIVSTANEVLWEPYVSVRVDAGMLRMMFLGMGMNRAERNPDGKTLEQVMPAELYARWRTIKARYMGNNRNVERKRPMIAADELFQAAIQAQGLSGRRIWTVPFKEAAATAGIPSTVHKVEIRLTSAQARDILKEARETEINDLACMEATLNAIEQDLPRMITNANAWSTGDINRLSFTQIQRRDQACADVMSNNDLAQKYGLPNIEQSIRARFIQEAEAAMRRNQTTVAVVPIAHILGSNGYAAQLRAKGYEVTAP